MDTLYCKGKGKRGKAFDMADTNCCFDENHIVMQTDMQYLYFTLLSFLMVRGRAVHTLF